MLAQLLRYGLMAAIVALMACGGGEKKSPNPPKEVVKKEKATEQTSASGETQKVNRRGGLIYKRHCNLCHGADGKLGLSGATDLSTSTLTLEESIYQVTNGKGAMTPYKNILSESQIKAVCEYLVELRK